MKVAPTEVDAGPGPHPLRATMKVAPTEVDAGPGPHPLRATMKVAPTEVDAYRVKEKFKKE